MDEFEDWLKLRHDSLDEYSEMLCYCGHTNKCTCADPDLTLFKESVRNKTIILGDPNNGWKSYEED